MECYAREPMPTGAAEDEGRQAGHECPAEPAPSPGTILPSKEELDSIGFDPGLFREEAIIAYFERPALGRDSVPSKKAERWMLWALLVALIVLLVILLTPLSVACTDDLREADPDCSRTTTLLELLVAYGSDRSIIP